MSRAAILVIDDAEGIRDLFRYHLHAEGVEVVVAASGEEGLARLRERPFDAVCLDLHMPGWGGLETLRRVREEGFEMPAILLSSAAGGAADEARTEGLGVRRVLAKPFHLADLDEALRSAGVLRAGARDGPAGGAEGCAGPAPWIAAGPGPGRRGRGHRVLVVDDEQGIRDFLRFALEGDGYEVLSAASVAEALALLEGTSVELLICDIRMPGGESGIDCLERVKERWPELEVILETGYGALDTAVEALRLGAFDYLQKPVETDQLIVAAARAIERSGLRRRVALETWTRAIFSTLDLGALVPLAERAAAEASGSTAATVVLASSEEEAGGGAADAPGLERLRALLLAGAGAAPRVLSPAEAAALAEGLEAHAGARAALIFPLERVNGLLFLTRRSDRAYASFELDSLAVLGAQIALSIENARLHGQLARRLEDLRRSREELAQAEKLAALGRFTGGIAHELNNPLTALLGFATMVAQDPAVRARPHLRADLDRVIASGERCAGIVARLVEFARARRVAKEPLDLHAIVRRVAARHQERLAPDGVAVELDIEPGRAEVLGNEAALDQVFEQVLLNAGQAILEAGRGSRVHVASRLAEGRAFVGVSDDGPGMPRSVSKRLFEPFFTTKPVGRGSGLGLCLAHGIVGDHGGRISVESEPGRGATFRIEFPLRARPEAAPPSGDGAAGPDARPRVLVADDEETIRDLVGRYCARNGIDATVVSDGREALELLRRERYDALLCDLRMPDVGGEAVCATLGSEQPEMIARTIILTGDVLTDRSSSFLADTRCSVLAKPFTLEDLDRVLKAVLRC